MASTIGGHGEPNYVPENGTIFLTFSPSFAITPGFQHTAPSDFPLPQTAKCDRFGSTWAFLDNQFSFFFHFLDHTPAPWPCHPLPF